MLEGEFGRRDIDISDRARGGLTTKLTAVAAGLPAFLNAVTAGLPAFHVGSRRDFARG